MAARHRVVTEQADEALADPDALVFDPDYASVSGRSVRTIAWSAGADRLLTVLTVTEGGVTYGGQRLAGQRDRHSPLPRPERDDARP